MVLNKWLRSGLHDGQFKVRFIILLGLLGISIWQVKMLTSQNQELARLENEVEDFIETAVAENELGNANVETVLIESPELLRKEINYEGTRKEGETLYALINGKILAQGDYIYDYQISQLTQEVAVLKNQERNEIRMVYLEDKTTQ